MHDSWAKNNGECAFDNATGATTATGAAPASDQTQKHSCSNGDIDILNKEYIINDDIAFSDLCETVKFGPLV